MWIVERWNITDYINNAPVVEVFLRLRKNPTIPGLCWLDADGRIQSSRAHRFADREAAELAVAMAQLEGWLWSDEKCEDQEELS